MTAQRIASGLLAAVIFGFGTVSAWQQTDDSKSTNAKAAKIDDLNWLSGSWSGESDGQQTEEQWLPPKAGMMLGVNRSVFANGKSMFEFLRIAETSDGLTYFASPRGAPATPFELKEISANRATFENLKNDFPQRIVYRRDEDRLIARIEGSVNGKAQSMVWNWTSATANHRAAK